MPIVEGDILRTTSGRSRSSSRMAAPSRSIRTPKSSSSARRGCASFAAAMEHRGGRLAGYAGVGGLPAAGSANLRQHTRCSGSWQYEAPYGYVWYPSVASDWRPYYNGSWSAVPSYGWTWIGTDAWSWPTHHYGRWGYGRNAWFWIPGRTWSAAWVTWASATDYVSWCPLGFDGRPVFALSTGVQSRVERLDGALAQPFRRARRVHASLQRRPAPDCVEHAVHRAARAPVAMRARGRGQSSVASRQSPVPSPQSAVPASPAISRQSSVGSAQSSVAAPVPSLLRRRQPAAVRRQSTTAGRPRCGARDASRTIAARPGVSDPRPAVSDPRCPDQRPAIGDSR